MSTTIAFGCAIDDRTWARMVVQRQHYVALRRWGRTRASHMEARPAALRALVPGDSPP